MKTYAKVTSDYKPTSLPILAPVGVVFVLWLLHGGSVELVEWNKPRVFVCHHFSVRFCCGHGFLVAVFKCSA